MKSELAATNINLYFHTLNFNEIISTLFHMIDLKIHGCLDVYTDLF